MKIKQFDIWIANLDPHFGTEAGKARPVLIIQSNLLNDIHPSTLICPITTNIQPKAEILRVHLKKGHFGLKQNCDIMIDQIRAIDNKRLMKRVGRISESLIEKVKENIAIVLDLSKI
ncbi:MAG: taxon MazF [Bacteroidetes bacterium GWF2_43_63]|nr:MAG: taxon MazF [Bacteroidetes bacterium GWE2_42_42]OFY55851.1 MAG: taxon MazF [Bacteroidetes bacterium GWF2_43_63]HBG71228.1 type II toxin-antitoxin system PemK/MazF family toxin [Bacteroidales bacterium]HCB60551.1 type II toxin-antitoxin system PemK/MazF family toxin [Bacteroidales bacterium]HCY22492.1 type II toxin-antitoxin system PemK/MazF family toxin [Bacteroidales bacterium]